MSGAYHTKLINESDYELVKHVLPKINSFFKINATFFNIPSGQVQIVAGTNYRYNLVDSSTGFSYRTVIHVPLPFQKEQPQVISGDLGQIPIVIQPIPGGYSQKNISDQDYKLIKSLLNEINSKLGTKSSFFNIRTGSTQVVNGTNYQYHLTESQHGARYRVVIYVDTKGVAQVSQGNLEVLL